jgi:DNA-binding NtrC family response regulator
MNKTAISTQLEKRLQTRILVVDDESSMCEFLRIMLAKEGYGVETRTSAHQALSELKQNLGEPGKKFNLIITDLMMPEMSGLELLKVGQKIDPNLDFIVMTAFGSIDTAVEALKNGAHDYITKPFKIEEIKIAIKNAVEERLLKKQYTALKENLATGFESFIGCSPSVIEIKRLAAKAAGSDVTILITGESGTGKEVLARAIHAESRRASGPFLSINCAALPETLLESELFGHMKGSFTGAVKDKPGLFAAATDGTFFLDEIGETSPAIQAKLLRVLEEKEFTPLGATKPLAADVRLIAATNANLQERVEHGAFRSDLFYRLNVFSLNIPPLRDRRDDIELLTVHFTRRHTAKLDLPEKTFSDAAMELLKSYSWPGNIRQLENLLERTVMLVHGDVIDIDDLPDEVRRSTNTADSTKSGIAVGPDLEAMEKAYIYYTLAQTGWNKNQTSKILGIDLSTLYRKIERYDLPKKL